MSIDNEILQEFLVEAGELFEQLNDQFVELEQKPDDAELLNAVFRAYHTIKGGAGFMKLTPMVEVCHRAEDAVNKLRQGERKVDDALVDVMFQVLDELEVMFDCVRNGEELQDADAELLQSLDNWLQGDAASSEPVAADTVAAEPVPVAEEATVTVAEPEPEPEPASEMDAEFEAMLQNAQQDTAGTDSDLITDDEFEAALDAIHGKGKGPGSKPAETTESPVATSNDSDLITDDEFEAALDAIHGKGKGPGSKPGETSEPPAATSNDSDLITDEEFEAALDAIHGKGKGPGAAATANEDTKPADTKPASDEQEDTKPKESAPAVETDNVVAMQASTDTATTSKAEKKTANKKPAAPAAETSVRVDTARLDQIMNLVGELVLVRNRLTTLKQTANNPEITNAISTLELVTSDLQSSVMKTRMQPIKKVFSRFPRVIRDLARKLKKDINLELIGEDTDLDKSLVEALADPLIHLVRNAADHGIESPEERFESGKSRQGKVTLSAQQEGDQILLTVSDDGKGMDHTVLRKKAVEKGMMSEDAAMSMTNKDAYNLIFAPGFSTKTEISDVSGRGVGMDVVKTRISELNGTIEIDSTLGKGSEIVIHLPLTLAILPTLMVNLGQYQFALPLTNVLEAFNMEPDQINVIDGQEVIRVRGKPLPLFYLQPWLVQNQQFEGPQLSQKIIVVQMGNQRFCLVVDHIAGQEEIVIKPLGSMLSTTPGFAGATITGDGAIALILDVPSLMGAYAANSAVY